MNLYLFTKYGDTNLTDCKVVVAAAHTREACGLVEREIGWGQGRELALPRLIATDCPYLNAQVICTQIPNPATR